MVSHENISRYFGIYLIILHKKRRSPISDRAGRGRELTRLSRSKFKMDGHHFSAAQLPSHQCVRKFVQFSSRRGSQVPSFSSVQFTNSSEPGSDWPGWLGLAQARFNLLSLQLFGRSSSRSPSVEITALRPGFVAWVEGWYDLWLSLLACLVCGVVSEWRKFSSKSLNKFLQFSSSAWSSKLPVLSVRCTWAKCLHSVRSAQFIHFSSWTVFRPWYQGKAIPIPHHNLQKSGTFNLIFYGTWLSDSQDMYLQCCYNLCGAEVCNVVKG